MIDLKHMDNMELMKGFDDNQFDLAIVDPPFGIGRDKGIGKRKGEIVFTKYTAKKWDIVPTKEYFIELKRVSENQIIWGANYFGLAFEKMIVWDKLIGDNCFAMAEIASSSFSKSTKIYQCFCGANRSGADTTRIHPTQKPVQLYKWLLNNYAKAGDSILDTHLGSGSIAIACYDLKFDLTACELDKEYFDTACKRLEIHQRQLTLF